MMIKAGIANSQHTLYNTAKCDWESWCYVLKRNPSDFTAYLRKVIKEQDIQSIVIIKGCDRSVPNRTTQPNFWHIDPDYLNSAMDSGVGVFLLELEEDEHQSLKHCRLPACTHFYLKDTNPDYNKIIPVLNERIQSITSRVLGKTPGCCRGKWL